MGSWLTVKVQMADLYAAQLAGRGYTAVKFFDGDRRGCFRCRLNRREWRTDLRMVPTVSRPDTPTFASFAVEDGRPDAVRV